MAGNPKECRRNALKCMQLAQTAPSPEAGDIESRQALVDLLNDLERSQKGGRVNPARGAPTEADAPGTDPI